MRPVIVKGLIFGFVFIALVAIVGWEYSKRRVVVPDDKRRVVFPDDTAVIKNPGIRGKAEVASFDGDSVIISGWAADLFTLRPATSVLIFVNGQLIARGAPTVDHPGAVRSYVAANLRRSGFSIKIPRHSLGGMETRAAVQVFATGPGGGGELDYGKNYPFAARFEISQQVNILDRQMMSVRAGIEALSSSVRGLQDESSERPFAISNKNRRAPSVGRSPNSQGTFPIYITPRDAYQYLDRGQDSFNAESKKVLVPCRAIPHSNRTAVLLIFGQSNSTNLGAVPYTPSGRVYEMNFFTGRCFVAADPLLGASGTGGSFASRLADQLINAGMFSDVLLVSTGVGGTYIEDWAPGGIHHRRILVAIRRLADAGFHPTFLLWHQGEGNTGINGNPEAYKGNFLDMLNAIRTHSVMAPVFVPLVSICGGLADPNVRKAQMELASPKLGIYPGPDTDTLGLTKRYDRCHFSGEGLDLHAQMWFRTLSHYVKYGPNDRGVRVTAETIGAGPGAPVLSQAVARSGIVRAEYASYGQTKGIISMEVGKASPSNGASVLSLTYQPVSPDSPLRVRVALNGFLTESNKFVVAVFRRDQPSPVRLIAQSAEAGHRVMIDSVFEVPGKALEPVTLDVRVGLATVGGEVFLNGDPKGPDKSLSEAFLEIQEVQ